MDLSRPYAAVSSGLEGEVLVTLSRTTRPLTGSEVARLVRRGTRPGIQRALHRLVGHGLVLSREAGRAFLYTLNREHLAFPAVELLAGIRGALLERLRERIAAWQTRAVHVSVFGSAARGDGGIDSDVDLLVVRPVKVDEEDPLWRSQVDDLLQSIERWTGNRAAVAEISEQRVARLKRDRPSVVGDLKKDAVVLAGLTTRQLLGGRR
ncbi:MAG TPA: nucleotidyltransferase domain-containing protein [Kofleriaceae bacterium]|nr:nucleotidyltransferase domain-containing protein [Kofleriaceae bacterium]